MKEYTCHFCKESFSAKRRRKYCSDWCKILARREAKKRKRNTEREFRERLYAGMRLLSDDFGEYKGDYNILRDSPLEEEEF